MERILITGGAGFIGNAIVKYLNLKEKYEIRVMDNFSPQIHGDNYLESYLYKGIVGKCSILKGDVRNAEDWVKALDNVDYIIHLAAETGTGQSMYEVNRYNDVNIMGLSNMFEIIVRRKSNIKKVILASSRAVYGEGMYHCEQHSVVFPKARNIEDMRNGDFSVKCPICKREATQIKTSENCMPSPISLYAFTKLAQEKIVEVMCPAVDIPYTVFRYQNVYGPGQSLKNPYTGILSIFSNLLLQNKPLNIFEDGQESRDFVFVDDVASATISAIENSTTDYQCINVGSGMKTTVLQVAQKLRQLYGSISDINITGDFRKGDIRHNVADIAKAEFVCDYKPRFSFEDGIKEFANWVIKSYDKEKQLDNSFIKSVEEMACSGVLIVGGKYE